MKDFEGPYGVHLEMICKVGHGANCCKYLVAGANGFECMKAHPENKLLIDENWAKTRHVA